MRLRYGYFITCTGVVKDDAGEVTEVHCTYDPATRGGNAPDGRKVKSTIHWVSAEHAIDAEVRLYETLFTRENPNEVDEGRDFTDNLNPKSLEVVDGREAGAEPGGRCARRAAISSSGWDISAPIRIHAGKAGVQSHRGAARHLGEDREEIANDHSWIRRSAGRRGVRVLKDGELLAADRRSRN